MAHPSRRQQHGALAFPPVKHDLINFQGGLDLVSPPLQLPTGMCINAQNFEVNVNGSYTRIDGYERSDGRPSPSAQSYSILAATITGAWVAGNTLTGATSGATAKVLSATTTTYFVLAKVVGTFVVGENLQIAAVTVAVCTVAAVAGGASTPILNAYYTSVAADLYRADILAIPGSGSVRGVWVYNDIVYGFRNNAGGTASVMYKQTAGGWVAVTMYNELAFNTGSTVFTVGGTVTQGGNTATVKAFHLTSGSWAGGNAAGILIVTTPAPGNFAAGALAGSGVATATGVQTAITLLPDGRYEFITYNFGGTAGSAKMYGCDGVNPAFEFDGTAYSPIHTGMTSDAPKYLTAHMHYLFLAFAGSAQHSGAGTPFVWSPILGAAELNCGETITGFRSQPGSIASQALLIMTLTQTLVLYGTSPTDWNLTTFAMEAGALPYTLKKFQETIALDTRGVTTLTTTQAYGSFSAATISARVKPFLVTEIPSVIAAAICRDKNQYRLFFSDGYALYVTLQGSNTIGMMPILLTDAATCSSSNVLLNGSEVMYIGTAAGYVMQMDKGTSFDGVAIDSLLHLVFNNLKGPRILKRYRKCALEVAGGGYAEFFFNFSLGYGSSEYAQPDQSTITTNLETGTWDVGTWDVGFWDGQTLIPSECEMTGTAENVSLQISQSTTYFVPLTFSGALLHYTPRRGMR